MGCYDCWALLDVLVHLIYPYLLLLVGLVRTVVGWLCKGRRKSVGYEEKKAAVVKEVLYNRRQGSPLAIGGKTTTNLFRFRAQPAAFRINVGHFTEVLEVNEKQLYCVAEGMTTFEGLVEETLKKGVMPAVVPELKSITIGGAISGVGVESTSFRYGFVHEMVEEMEVLLADGRTVVCSASNEHSDLFYGLANSYGSLGYILKVKFRCIPVKKYVQLRYFRYNDATKLFRDMKTYCEQPDTDFVDGVMFDKDELYLILGTFVDTAPFVSDYKHMNIFWQSIPQRNTDYLTVKDYIWRWDTDWFWCSRYFYMNNPLVRAMFGLAGKLRSVTYMWIWRTYINMGLYRQPREFVIQDVEIPLKNCTQFLEFFHDEIGIKPVWMCPVRSFLQKCKYPLYLIDPSTLYVNFGFWDTVEVKSGQKDKTNIALEHKVAELSGKKSLYSSVHYTEDDFWKNYNKEEYLRLKSKYDSNSYLLGLYEKTAGKK